MKKIGSPLYLLCLALTLTLLTGCKKKAAPEEPETAATPVAPASTKELQSALDATWATYVITDVEQMCAFMGNNELFNSFYTHTPSSPTVNQTAVQRNIQAKDLRMIFNDTRCMDGRVRNGTVFMRYEFDPVRTPGANPNSEYYDEFGFYGELSLLNYRVDGWLIENYDLNSPAKVFNEMVSLPFNPKTTNLRWQIVGKFKFTQISDSLKQRSIVWDGKIFKTIDNTSNSLVYSTNRLSPVNYSLAVCSYSGNVTGLTNSVEPFTMEVGTVNNPVVRDFSCHPDKGLEEHHPFVKGIATFKAGTAEPYQIVFGQQCDSVAEIMIKGFSYQVNLRK